MLLTIPGDLQDKIPEECREGEPVKAPGERQVKTPDEYREECRGKIPEGYREEHQDKIPEGCQGRQLPEDLEAGHLRDGREEQRRGGIIIPPEHATIESCAGDRQREKER